MANPEIYIAVNEDDDYESATDEETAIQLLKDTHGGQAVKVYRAVFNDLPAPTIEAQEIVINVTMDTLAGTPITIKMEL